GRAARRRAAGVQRRHWRRAAPAAGHFDHRRPAAQPTADVIHNAGHLSRLRPFSQTTGSSASPQPRRPPGWGNRLMNFSALFINRPVATTLLTVAVGLAGTLAYFFLPVSPLPQVDFPTIQVQWRLPGASPETMASSVATPLERQFGRIAGITEMTSSSSLGSSSVVLQFDLNRNIDAAARDVQAAINAARSNLPANLPTNPSYRKVNPADAPVLILGLTSDTLSRGQMYDVASTLLQQKLAQVEGIGQVIVGGSSLPAVRVELNPTVL